MSDIAAKNPICKNCLKEELTDEEALMGRQTGYQCFYCIAYLSLQANGIMPDPSRYGRAGVTKEEVLAHNAQTFQPPQSAQETKTKSAPQLPEGMQKALIDAGVVKQQLTGNNITTIIAHGSNEQTYIKFEVPGNIPEAYQQEFERLLKEMLNLFGNVLAFGPNFTSTLQQLKKINFDMFLGK